MTYQLYGLELSPYSVKLRAYLRYKQLPFIWINRRQDNQSQFDHYARPAIIPLLIDAEDIPSQDSTPIMKDLSARHSTPPCTPEDPALAWLSLLLEEFADEWANKWMFHYRWNYSPDDQVAAIRFAKTFFPNASANEQKGVIDHFIQRMQSRTDILGVDQTTNQEIIETSFEQAISQLATHLASRPYLFGKRPSFADFGLWGQLYSCWLNPSCAPLIESQSPALLDWLQRMPFARDEGDYESWTELADTLLPFLQSQLANLFLPWTQANSQASAMNKENFSVTLSLHDWTQKVQKYSAKSFTVLTQHYQQQVDNQQLQQILDHAGCLNFFSSIPITH